MIKALFCPWMTKLYLRRGTDVGMRDAKSGKIYDVSDKAKQRNFPSTISAVLKFISLLHPFIS